jgi:glutathione S-transferase
MLELKGIDYQLVDLVPGMQRVQLRLAGFRGGTVPALKLDGQRIQGSRRISRALDELQPEPRLFPADPDLRQRVEEAERWGEEELQPIPRRLFRYGLVHDVALREWLGKEAGIPGARIGARLSGPNARYYAYVVGANEETTRRDLAALPGLLDRADALLADGTLATDPLNAATTQVLSSVRMLDEFADLHDEVAPHPSAAAAREVFPSVPGPIPSFLPAELRRSEG